MKYCRKSRKLNGLDERPTACAREQCIECGIWERMALRADSEGRRAEDWKERFTIHAKTIALMEGRINELEQRYALLRQMASWVYTAHDDMVQLSIQFDKQPLRPTHGDVLAADELDRMVELALPPTNGGRCPEQSGEGPVAVTKTGLLPPSAPTPYCPNCYCETCRPEYQGRPPCERCGRSGYRLEECTDEKCARRTFYTLAKPFGDALPEIFCSRHGRIGSTDGSCPACGQERALKRPITPDYHSNPLVIRRCSGCAHEWRANMDGRICPGCGKEASE